MRNPIQKLSGLLVSQIAAGEVVESPAGALKELLENSLDASATTIDIFIRENGLGGITVRDNGNGIAKEDLPLALESFSTSKISTIDDLHSVCSLGFRGEALGAIQSISHTSIESYDSIKKSGWRISAAGNEFSAVKPSPISVGTQVKIDDLFFNMPVRKTFQKNNRKLKKSIIDLVTAYALANEKIAFTLKIDDKDLLNLPARELLTQRIQDLFSEQTAMNIIPVYNKQDDMELKGYISNFRFYHSNASQILFFANNRWVNYRPMVGILKKAYGELMPPGKFPSAFLFLNLPANQIDVNIHPQKKEIRFREDLNIYNFIITSLLKTIESEGSIKMKNTVKILPTKQGLSPHTPRFTFLPNLKIEPKETLTHFEQVFENMPEGQIVSLSKPELDVSFPHKVHLQLFDTFFLASSEDGLFLIDQHTAHERINYEKFLVSLRKNEKLGQPLLNGIAIHLSPAERIHLQANTALLEHIGFHLEQNGPNDFLVLQVPFYVSSGSEESATRLALKIIEEKGKIDATILFENLAKDLSCRASVKKGESLSFSAGEALISQLSKCEHPARCPHGRPTMIFLGRQEIYEMFKR